MTKSKKAVADTADKKTTKFNWAGFPVVIHLLAELIAVYTFVTQQNKVLLGVGFILGLHAAWQLATKFMYTK